MRLQCLRLLLDSASLSAQRDSRSFLRRPLSRATARFLFRKVLHLNSFSVLCSPHVSWVGASIGFSYELEIVLHAASSRPTSSPCPALRSSSSFPPPNSSSSSGGTRWMFSTRSRCLSCLLSQFIRWLVLTHIGFSRSYSSILTFSYLPCRCSTLWCVGCGTISTRGALSSRSSCATSGCRSCRLWCSSRRSAAMLSSEATSSAGAVARHRHRYDHSILSLYIFRSKAFSCLPCVLLDRHELHYSIPLHLMNLCIQ